MSKATTQSDKVPAKILTQILQELRLLREQLSLVMPQDNLDDYDDANRVTASYRKALKRFPPRAIFFDIGHRSDIYS